MRSLAFIFSALFVVFSCDDKTEALERLNLAPTIEYFSKSTGQWLIAEGEISDSAKVYTKENGLTYSLKIRAKDKNNNFENIRIEETNLNGGFFLNDVEFQNATTTQLDSFTFSCGSVKEGIRRFKIIATDDFGKSNEINFNLVFVPNKIPVAKLKISHIGIIDPNEYIIDGSESFDGDVKLGGKPVQYEYNIDNLASKKKDNDAPFKRIFKEGKHKIRLRVKDNDGKWSKQVVDSINVASN